MMKGKDYTPYLSLSPAELRRGMKRRGWALSAVGCVVWAVLRLFGRKPVDFEGICPSFRIGKSWGGVSFGWFFICGKEVGDATMCHEVGHLVQNAAVGGLSMLGYSIVSAFRYWWCRISKSKKPYDGWWFEGQATRLGAEYVNRVRSDHYGSQ